MGTSLILMAALLGAPPTPPPPAAAPSCTVASGDEARTVAWLRGDYGVLGISNGQPYTGKLTLSGTEDSESLDVSGTVDGVPRRGKATYVHCGPDRVRQLEIRLGSGRVFFCVPHVDYDNLNRASCSRRSSDLHGNLELWFQRLEP